MENLVLQDIYIYPIKSLGGIKLNEAEVQERGLKLDRRWMLVDAAGNFLTQRRFPEMAFLQVSLYNDGLVVTNKKDPGKTLTISLTENTGKEVTVNIWDDTCTALEVNAAADNWFTEILKMPAKLVVMPETTRRLVDIEYADDREIVGFADAYPFLIIGQSSLDDLNNRLEGPVTMKRFRPNFVFSGGDAFIEDEFRSIKIGDVEFKGVKLCSRCVLTTIDPETGEKGSEPLKTLITYRLIGNKVMFGQNLLPASLGLVRVGDKIEFK